MNRHDWENDDFFLDQLSQGKDPSQGQDPLAAALLGLRTEIESNIPAAPELSDVPAGDTTGASDNVVALNSVRRQPSHRRSFGHERRNEPAKHRAGTGSGFGASRRFGWGSALLGAAAATALFAVGSLSVYHATPNSPLWGVHESLFDDEKATRVELATTLEQLEDSAHRGDEETTRQLIAEARTLLDNLRESKEAKQNKENKTSKPRATVTRVRPQPEEKKAPETVTETKEVTVTKTESPMPQAPQTAPDAGQEPAPQTSASQPSAGQGQQPGQSGNDGAGQLPSQVQPQPQVPGQGEQGQNAVNNSDAPEGRENRTNSQSTEN